MGGQEWVGAEIVAATGSALDLPVWRPTGADTAAVFGRCLFRGKRGAGAARGGHGGWATIVAGM